MLITAVLHYYFCGDKTNRCNNKLSIILVNNIFSIIKLNKSLIISRSLLRKLNPNFEFNSDLS